MATKPKFPIVSVLCMTDGTMRDFEDDGTDSAGKPRVRRLNLMAAGKKKFKNGGGNVFRRGKAVIGKDGKKLFVPVRSLGEEMLDDAIAPLDEEGIRFVEAAVIEHEKREEAMKKKAGPEAIAFLEAFLAKIKGGGLQSLMPTAAAMGAPAGPSGPGSDAKK